MVKRTPADENRLIDEAILGAAADKQAELEREFKLPSGDLMRVVNRGEVAVIVLNTDSLRLFKEADRTRDKSKLPAATKALHQAITKRAEQLGKRVLVRGEYTTPKPAPREKRQRPSSRQLQQRFSELVDQVGFAADEIAQSRPGTRVDLRVEADELKRARWYVASQLRASFDPPPTFPQIGAVMGVTGPRVHQIVNEFEEEKEEVDGK